MMMPGIEITCPNCGAPQEGNAKKCIYCNTPFNNKKNEMDLPDLEKKIQTLLDLCRFEEANKLCDDGLMQNPDHIPLWILKILGLMGTARYNEAITLIDNAMKRVKTKKALTVLEIFKGQCYMNMNRMDDALASFNNALVNNPNNPDLLYPKARILIAQNKESDALVTINKGLTLEPKSERFLQLQKPIIDNSNKKFFGGSLVVGGMLWWFFIVMLNSIFYSLIDDITFLFLIFIGILAMIWGFTMLKAAPQNQQSVQTDNMNQKIALELIEHGWDFFK